MSISIHIDRLVVDAGVAGDPAALEAGVIAALRDALGETARGDRPRWWSADSTLPALRATLAPGTDMGTAIAAAVHAGLTTPPERAR